MKHLVFAVMSLLIAVSPVSANEVLRLSDPVESDPVSETFGASLEASLPRLSLRELIDGAESNLGQNVLIETKVGKVCQRKGCFFMAMDGSLAIRVSFRDYGFFVPTDSGGKMVMLSGELIERELTEEQAAHFGADMGGGKAALAAGKVYEIVADSVRIPI